MTFAIVITALAVFLCGASVGILAVLVAGIRSEDRAQNLTRAPGPAPRQSPAACSARAPAVPRRSF